jgi:UbiD family decarboxylase
MSRDLRSFLSLLEEKGLLVRVKRIVDRRFELAALITKVQKVGKAVLFENVSGSSIPVVSNVVGSKRMLALALGVDVNGVLDEYICRSAELVQPKLVDYGPVQEVVKVGEEASVDALPIVTHSELDAGPYITAGIAVAKDPELGFRNASFNRMQVKGARKLGIRMMPPQHLGVIHSKCEAIGRNLEVAIVIGNHPIEMIAGSTTLPYGVDHFSFASSLRREPLKLVKCKTIDVEVPADAEIVLEGEVLAGVREAEGPYGDFMQFYVPVMENHVFRLKAITHRRNPIYQTILAGTPEDTTLLALSREALIYQAVKNTGAEVKSVSLTPNLFNCVISIKKRFEGEPKNVAMAAFGAYYWLKYCIVVDDDVNPYDLNDVWWALATRSKPDTGIFITPSARGFPRDPHNLHQTKVGIDATAPLSAKEEYKRRRIPGEESIQLEDYI